MGKGGGIYQLEKREGSGCSAGAGGCCCRWSFCSDDGRLQQRCEGEATAELDKTGQCDGNEGEVSGRVQINCWALASVLKGVRRERVGVFRERMRVAGFRWSKGRVGVLEGERVAVSFSFVCVIGPLIKFGLLGICLRVGQLNCLSGLAIWCMELRRE